MVPAGTAPTKQKTLHRSKRHRSKEASATAKTATIAAKQQKDSREAVPFQHPAAKKRRVVAAAAAADETRVVADDNTAATAGTVPGFPYHVDPDDHCESPLDAYQDIAPLLQSIIIREPALDLSRHAKQSTPTSNDNSNETPTSTNHKNHGSAADKNKNNGNPLRIYDPYYCDGAVIQNLTQLGLPNVYNRKEDCYSVWKNSTESLIPPFDVLVTNPPYSEDHIERLFRFLTSPTFGHRRWFVLLPTWVHKKDFYTNATNRIAPFYLIPHRRYVYLPPPNFRESKKSSVHRKSSPFVSMWYCWGGTTEGNNQLMQQFYHYNKTLKSKSQCDLARSKSALRDLRRKPRK